MAEKPSSNAQLITSFLDIPTPVEIPGMKHDLQMRFPGKGTIPTVRGIFFDNLGLDAENTDDQVAGAQNLHHAVVKAAALSLDVPEAMAQSIILQTGNGESPIFRQVMRFAGLDVELAEAKEAEAEEAEEAKAFLLQQRQDAQ